MVQSDPADLGQQPARALEADGVQALKFEAALAELEAIVQNMEGGRMPLEEAIAAYRRGAELLRHCQQQLADAERKIEVLENGTLRDFDLGVGGRE